MNPEKPSREEIELKLTALLLGELPDDEAQLLRWAISQDTELARLHERLKLTIGFVREVAANPAEANPPLLAPLKLSDERREKLLAHFKTVTPREFVPEKKRREISSFLVMAAAIALIAVLAAMLLPALSKAKNRAFRAGMTQNDNQFAMERKIVDENLPATATPPPAAPQVAEGQRVAGVEAYIQNGEPTANGGDRWPTPPPVVTASPAAPIFARQQTQIILPQSDLALANADPQQVQQALQNTFGGNTVKTSPTTTDMLTTRATAKPTAPQNNLARWDNSPKAVVDFNLNGGGGFGGGGGRRGGSDRLANSFAGDVENAPGFQQQLKGINQRVVAASDESISTGLARDDVSGLKYLLGTNAVALDSDATQNRIAGQSRFYRNRMPDAAEADADKVPMLGDSPTVGSLFKSQNRSINSDGDIDSYKLAAKSYDTPVYSTAPSGQPSSTTIGGDSFFALGVNKDGNGNLSSVASDQFLTGGLRNDGLDSQINKSRIDNFGLALPVAAPPPITTASRISEEKLALDSKKSATATINFAWGSFDGSTNEPQVLSAGGVILTGLSRQILVGSKLSPAQTATAEDRPIQKTPSPASIPQPEILTRENAFSTFSLNVSDVSFKLAAASLQNGVLPEAGSIRSEEFINAFDYRDPEPAAGVPVAFVSERARDPFANNRDLLRFSIKTAAQGRQAGRPLNIVLLLDNSGSMERADRVAIIHEALRVLASQLQPQDTLSIVTFARTARLWVDGVSGDHAGEAVSKVSELTPEGGTNLEEAMKLAYATALRHYLANGGNRVVLLTDGAANLGNVDPEALKQQVEVQRKQGIALDCFGIGWEGYNDDLLEQLSSNGDGRYGFINTPEEAATGFAAQLAGALQVAAEDVKVQVEFNPQRVISYRQIGYAKHQLTKEQFRDNTVAAAPLAAQEAGNALYTVEINPQGEGPVATVRVRFRIPGTQEVSEHEWPVPFNGGAPALEQSSPALRLAATASAFSEWLASSPFAQEVTTDQLLNYLGGVPEIYGADPRPKKLEWMIRQAKSLSGK